MDNSILKRIISAEKRVELYNEVWKDPVSTVAKKYGISDVGLRKHLERYDIPVPPRGYWEKIRAGQKVKKTPLQIYTEKVKEHVKNYVIKYITSIRLASNEDLKSKEELYLLTDDTKKLIKETCSRAEVKSQFRSPHNLIIEHIEEIKIRRGKIEEQKKSRFFSSYVNEDVFAYQDTRNKPILPIRASNKNIKRAYKIIDAIIFQIDKLEGKVSLAGYTYGKDNGNFTVLNTSFEFELKGSLRNKDNEERLVLTMSASEGVYDGRTRTLEYKESKDKKLEDEIGNIIYQMFVIAYERECEYELKSRERNKKREEEKIKENLGKIRKEEFEKLEILQTFASDWSNSKKIREFLKIVEPQVDRIEDNEKREKMIKWIEWAKRKADWLDPFVEFEDELLGKSSYIFDAMENENKIKNTNEVDIHSWLK